MKISAFLLAWVMVNGFPVASFETCAAAEEKAAEIFRRSPSLQVRVECNSEQVAEPDAASDASPPADSIEEREAV